MTPTLWWRQLRADGTAVATLLVLLAMTTFLGVAGTRWLTQVDDSAVGYALLTSPERDDVLVAYETTLAAGPETAQTLLESKDEVLSTMAAPLPSLLDPAVVAVSTPELPLLGADGVTRSVELPPIGVTLTGIASASPPVRYVEGRAPAATTAVRGPFPLLEDARDPSTARVVEVAVAQLPATAATVAVGEVLTLGGPSPVIVEVTGIFEPLDATDYFWARQRTLLTNEPVYGPDGIISDAITALVPPEAFESFASATSNGIGAPLEMQITMQYPLAIDRVTASTVPALRVAADRADSKPVAVGNTPVQVSTSIQTPLDRYLRQHATAYAVLAIGLAGQLVTALTVLVLAARVITERRRTGLSLARARGASLRQLVGTGMLEAAVVAAAGVALGAAAAVLVVPGRTSPTTWWLCGLLVAASALVLGAIIAIEHRSFARTERQDLARTRPSPRRIAVEAALLIAAVGGVVLLRRRGLDATVVGGSVDPYIVAVPVLVALASALLVLRLYPLPMRTLARVAGGRRGLVGFLGLARAGRQTASAAAPVVVLLVGLSFAVFSSVLLHTVQVEQQAVSWDAVGGDLRVSGTDFNPEAGVAPIAAAAGVTVNEVFGVHIESTATLRGRTGAEEFDLLLLDPAAYQAFVAAHPVDTSGLDLLVEAPSGAGERVPALISPRLQSALRLGTTGEVPFYLPGTETVLDVLGVERSFPGYDEDEFWAVARTSDAEQVVDLPYWPTILFLDAPSADPDTVLTAARDVQRFAVLSSRDAEYEAIADAPLIRATGTAFAVAIGVAAGYCLLAILLALVVGARSRGRFLSYLRTLGLSSGQARWLAAWEIAPPAVVATAVGAGLGLLLPRIVVPAIDLRPFTGGIEPPQLLVNAVIVVALSVGLLVVVTAAVFVITSANRRRHLGAVLRVGEDS